MPLHSHVRSHPRRPRRLLSYFAQANFDDAYLFTRALSDAEMAALVSLGCYTGIPTGLPSVPTSFALRAGRPNPFRLSTTIAFDLPMTTKVRLVMFDVGGRLVKRLIDGRRMEPGRYRVSWSGEDGLGHKVGAGIYFVRLKAGPFDEVQKVTFMK